MLYYSELLIYVYHKKNNLRATVIKYSFVTGSPTCLNNNMTSIVTSFVRLVEDFVKGKSYLISE